MNHNARSFTDWLSERNDVIRMARAIRTIIRILAGALAFSFAWLKFSGIPLPDLNNDNNATIILRIALILYYSAWLGGVLLDSRDEEDILLTTPYNGKLPFVGLGLCALITAVFGLMCWVDTYHRFLIVLFIFWIVDKFSWMYMSIQIIQPSVKASRIKYEEDNDQLFIEQLDQISGFFKNNWHWWRFGFGLLYIGVLIVFANTSLGDTVVNKIDFLSTATFFSVGILIFIIVFEVWVWFFRLRRHFIFRFITKFRKKQKIK